MACCRQWGNKISGNWLGTAGLTVTGVVIKCPLELLAEVIYMDIEEDMLDVSITSLITCGVLASC